LFFISISVFIIIVLRFIVGLFVVLMKLLTGLTALDESRSEEIRYLVEWFWQIKSKKENLMYVVDPALEPTEETYKSITIVAKLAGHCTAREAYHRPDMSNTYTHKK
jgi:hypothetical protein